MPVIRVSNETYQILLELQAKDGNSMSIFMDRLMARYKELEDAERSQDRERTEGGDKKRTRKTAGKSGKKGKSSREWLLGIEGLVRE